MILYSTKENTVKVFQDNKLTIKIRADKPKYCKVIKTITGKNKELFTVAMKGGKA